MRLIPALAAAALAAAPALAAPDAAQLAKARAVLAKTPVIDGHNDLPWEIHTRFADDPDKAGIDGDTRGRLHTDFPRLKAGGVGGQFWSVWIPADLSGPPATTLVMQQIDLARRMIEARPDKTEFAATAADVVRIQKAGKVASMIGIEGGNAIDGKLSLLRQFRRAGVAYMTLTHSKTLPWADSATDAPKSDGLSPFGEQVVREMNRIGMLVDLSHVSAETMKDALRVARAPVIFSHSSARAVDGHPRNVPDEILPLVAQNGGVVMINVFPMFVQEKVRQWTADSAAEEARLKSLNPGDPQAVKAGLDAWTAAHPRPSTTIKDVADHADHLKKVAGVDHVGLGGDFDGVPYLPEDMPGVEAYPALIAELLSRGWSEADVAKLAGGNILRVMRQAEAMQKALANEKPALDTAP